MRSSAGPTHALQSFQYLLLFSPSASALGPRDLLASCLWYRLYLVAFSAASTLLLLYVMSLEATVTVSPFNLTALYLYYWIVQYFIIISPLIDAKKMRMQKILLALEELDLKIRFRSAEVVQKNRAAVGASIAAAIVYHVVVHVLVVWLLVASGVDPSIITLTYWFKVLEFAVDVELLCLGSLVLLLCHRAELFVAHLRDILARRLDDSDLNLLLCHRQLHYVLKTINKAYETKVTVIVYFVTILSLRNLSLCIWRYENKLLSYVGAVLVCRYVLLLALLGAAGQRVANSFDSIHLLATDIKASSHLNSEVRRRGAGMCAEGALRTRRLAGCALRVDARLPLRVLSAIGTILVFIFSIKIDMNAV